MKYLLPLLPLTAFAAQPVTQEVKIPVCVSCVLAMPIKPTFEVQTLGPGASDGEQFSRWHAIRRCTSSTKACFRRGAGRMPVMAKKPISDPQSCGTCKHFLQNEKDEFGYCRRYPLVPTVDDGATVTASPVVHASDLCDEYGRKLDL